MAWASRGMSKKDGGDGHDVHPLTILKDNIRFTMLENILNLAVSI